MDRNTGNQTSGKLGRLGETAWTRRFVNWLVNAVMGEDDTEAEMTVRLRLGASTWAFWQRQRPGWTARGMIEEALQELKERPDAEEVLRRYQEGRGGGSKQAPLEVTPIEARVSARLLTEAEQQLQPPGRGLPWAQKTVIRIAITNCSALGGHGVESDDFEAGHVGAILEQHPAMVEMVASEDREVTLRPTERHTTRVLAAATMIAAVAMVAAAMAAWANLIITIVTP